MNIFCPNCENECSEKAIACPKCGHPLQVVTPGVTRKKRGPLWWFLPAGVLGLLGAAVFAVYAVSTGESASRPGDATSRKVAIASDGCKDLTAAMKAAASKLPEIPDAGEHGKHYRAALSRGDIIVAAGKIQGRDVRAVSIAFANAMNDSCRNAWLRACMDRVAKKDSGDEIKMMALRAGWSNASLCGISSDQRTYEAIFNLATDASLRVEAENRWKRIAMISYDEDMKYYEQEDVKYQKDWHNGRPSRPEMPVIPLWNK